VSDLDSARVAMLIAVLQRHGDVFLGDREIYAATVGGIGAREPSVDLAILLALNSAVRDEPIPATACAIGEVSLSGDVRRVTGLGRRLAEAARLGFTCALVPAGHAGDVVPASVAGIRTVEVATLGQAQAAVATLRAERAVRRPILRSVGASAPTLT
jgi:DNA repair protein RadA/Sms